MRVSLHAAPTVPIPVPPPPPPPTSLKPTTKGWLSMRRLSTSCATYLEHSSQCGAAGRGGKSSKAAADREEERSSLRSHTPHKACVVGCIGVGDRGSPPLLKHPTPGHKGTGGESGVLHASKHTHAGPNTPKHGHTPRDARAAREGSKQASKTARKAGNLTC